MSEQISFWLREEKPTAAIGVMICGLRDDQGFSFLSFCSSFLHSNILINLAANMTER